MSPGPRRLPVVDLARAIEGDRAALEEAAVRVLRGGRFVLGPEVAAFEREACDFLGATHAVGVSSGTDALYLALRALGVGVGTSVLVPVFGFVATAEAIVRTGAEPIFVDVLPGCGRVNLDDAARRMRSDTRALVHVSLGGDGGGTADSARWCRERGLALVEDAAQSFGARDEGRAIGTHGDASAFSFFPAKVLGGFGDGGLVVTAREEVAARVRSLRQHGRSEEGRFLEFGANARLDELQAALLRVRLGSLPHELTVRADLAARYDRALLERGLAERSSCATRCLAEPRSGLPVLLPARCSPGHAHGLYTVRLGAAVDRAKLRADLAARGIDSAIYYAHLLVEEPAFAMHTPREGVAASFPGARNLAACTLTLPFFVGMGDDDLARVADALAASLQST